MTLQIHFPNADDAEMDRLKEVAVLVFKDATVAVVSDEPEPEPKPDPEYVECDVWTACRYANEGAQWRWEHRDVWQSVKGRIWVTGGDYATCRFRVFKAVLPPTADVRCKNGFIRNSVHRHAVPDGKYRATFERIEEDGE